MNLSELQELYRHMEWADASVWQAVLRTEAAAADQKIPGLITLFGFGWTSRPRVGTCNATVSLRLRAPSRL